jgi:hypothetical protein
MTPVNAGGLGNADKAGEVRERSEAGSLKMRLLGINQRLGVDRRKFRPCAADA